MKTHFFIIIILLISSSVFSQNQKYRIVYSQVIDGDTLFIIPLDEVQIKGKRTSKNKRLIRRTNRLIRYVKKVYPYAKIAGVKLQEYDSILNTVDKESERRKIMRRAEKEINEEFGGELKKLTINQGKILLKLIDRETGDTSFELVKDLRGGFTAFFYQTFARIFTLNLKVKYDPQGEDKKIEEIVQLIENGQL